MDDNIALVGLIECVKVCVGVFSYTHKTLYTLLLDHQHFRHFFILNIFQNYVMKYQLINIYHNIALIGFPECINVCVEVFSCRSI